MRAQVIFSYVVVLATFFCLKEASAGYDGPKIDYNFIMQKPAEFLICEQERFNASLDIYKMCSKAQNAAEAFAERYGTQEGMLEGYLRGYAWGLNKSVNAYKDDQQEMQRGAANVLSLGEYFQTASDAARSKGQQDGTPQGAQEVQNRFRAAVNTQQFPSDDYQVPAVSYTVEGNAYQTHVLNGAAPHNAKDILQEDSFQQDIPIFGSMQSTSLREREANRPYHYWYSNRDSQGRLTSAGIYHFETSHWDDGDVAFDVWKQRSGSNDAINYYDNLLMTQERAAGTPGADGAVRQGPLMSDLYREIFVKSYRYWAQYYFSRSFHQQIDLGQVTGETLGKQVGKRIAYEKGLEVEFNRAFVEKGKEEYQWSFSDSYSTAFKNTYKDYANNPHLEVKLERLIGKVDDGIIQPGEEINGVFTLTNIGGVSSTVELILTGNVENAKVTKLTSIKRLSSSEWQTGFVAEIDPRLQPRDVAEITISINGKAKDTLKQTVNRLVEIIDQEVTLDVLSGSGEIVIVAKNLSTSGTKGKVSGELKVSGQSITSDVGNLGAGQSKRITLSVSDLDPLEIIKGGLKAEVAVLHQQGVMEQRTVDLLSEDALGELVTYFDQLANEKGMTPGNMTQKSQLGKVKEFLLAENKKQVRRNSKRGDKNIFRKYPSSVIVGDLATTFTSHKQSKKAEKSYDNLAQEMIKESKNFKPFLGISCKRRHYRKLVRVFSKDPKLK